MSPAGIATVARQEFTIRIRAGRLRWVLGGWFVVLVILTALITRSLNNANFDQSAGKGVVIYGLLTLIVLGLALLIAPGLSSQSVNGDRDRGTLATLQVTRLSPGDIAVGKLLAAWGTALVFLLLSAPMVAYSMTEGGVPLLRVLVVSLIVILLLGSVIAIALCLSALVSRSNASGMLAYLVVFLLTIGTLVAFGIGRSINRDTTTVTQPGFCSSVSSLPGVPTEKLPSPGLNCSQPQTFQEVRDRGDKVWWLLAPNPYVILADAAPALPPESAAEQQRQMVLARQGLPSQSPRGADPLGSIGRAVKGVRLHPGEILADTGYLIQDGSPKPKVVQRRLVWPYGLAFDVLLGALALWLTAHRLKTPTRKLAKGQRIA